MGVCKGSLDLSRIEATRKRAQATAGGEERPAKGDHGISCETFISSPSPAST